MFCKRVVTWKYLRHPNVVPLIGAVMDEAQLVFVSEWISNGNVNEFVKKHPDADRLGLVGFRSRSRCLHFRLIDDRIIPSA